MFFCEEGEDGAGVGCLQGQRGDVSGAGGVWMVGAWEAYGCVDAKDYSFPEEKNSLSRSPRKVSGQDKVR